MPVELRSDTMTRPSPAMRRAMAAAQVGDDVFHEDPTVNRLQERVADMLGREAALFVPSGTQGNLSSLLGHELPRGSEVLLESNAHIINHENNGITGIGGLLPRAVTAAAGGILAPEQVEAAIQPDHPTFAPTRLLCLENSCNQAGGTVYEPERTRGALRPGAPPRSARPPRRRAAVQRRDRARLHAGRGRGAPSTPCPSASPRAWARRPGSIVVGSRDFIRNVRRYRQMCGGQMRQVGVLRRRRRGRPRREPATAGPGSRERPSARGDSQRSSRRRTDRRTEDEHPHLLGRGHRPRARRNASKPSHAKTCCA